MTRLSPLLLLLMVVALSPMRSLAQGDGNGDSDMLAIRFEPSSSRLKAGEAAQLDRLATQQRGDPDATLSLVVPTARDPMRGRFLAARVAALEHQLSDRGLSVRHQSRPMAAGDGDILWISRQSGAPAPSAPVSLAPPTPVAGGGLGGAPPISPSVAPATQDWSALAGRSLRAILLNWAASAGWTIIWQSVYDYPLEASANFSGDFPTAAASILRGFRDATPAPTAQFYRENQVMLVR